MSPEDLIAFTNIVEKGIDMKIIDYSFYRIYHLFKKGEDSTYAAFLSTIAFTVIVFFNVFAIGTFLRKLGIIPYFIHSKITGISLEIILFGMGWLLFLRKKKYVDIENRFREESRHTGVLGNIGVILILILSFSFLVIAGKYKS